MWTFPQRDLDTDSFTCLNTWKVFLQSCSGQELSIPIKNPQCHMAEPKMAKSEGFLVVVMPFQANGKWGSARLTLGSWLRNQRGHIQYERPAEDIKFFTDKICGTLTGDRNDKWVRRTLGVCLSVHVDVSDQLEGEVHSRMWIYLKKKLQLRENHFR